MRGDIHRLRAPRGTRGNEQRGFRYAVILQSDDLMLSTLIVAPTSTSAHPRIFRPTILISGEATQVLTEQTVAVAPERLGDLVGHASLTEQQAIDASLRLTLGID